MKLSDFQAAIRHPGDSWDRPPVALGAILTMATALLVVVRW